MADSINLIFDEDGVARIYDDTYDITIHCESQEEQDAVLAKLNRRWIPCSERLPEKDGIYIVCFDKGHLRKDEIQVETAYWLNAEWQYSCLESYEHRMPRLVIEPIKELPVIAWMPLPEPYKAERREE